MTGIVLMKPIHDPTVPLTMDEVTQPTFGYDEKHMVFGPYDENALETALQVKDRTGISITVVVVHQTVPDDLLRSVLAAGADQVLIVRQNTWSLAPRQLGAILRAVVDTIDESAWVLAGLQSGDWDTGIIPPVLAAEWNRPYASHLVALDPTDAGWIVTTREGAMTRRLRALGPFVASVSSSGTNTLRYPTMRDRLQAKRKPIVAVDLPPVSTTLAPTLVWAAPPERRIEWIEGASNHEKGQALVRRLRDAGWLHTGGASS
jgi:electron transfer flavoprotein beta subunit